MQEESMARYKLYCFGESGNAYKVALMLETARADWQPEFVDFFGGATRTPEFRNQVNEMGEIPVLVDEQTKTTLTQSGVILFHLAEALKAFEPKTPVESNEVLRWMLFDNHKLTSPIASLRFMINFAKTGETPVTEWLRNRAITSLKIVDGHLAKQQFFAADRITIADFSLCGYLFYGDELTIDLAAFPNVSAWLERIKALPGWKHPYDLMPRKTG
jgi:glutathione S-transferase